MQNIDKLFLCLIYHEYRSQTLWSCSWKNVFLKIIIPLFGNPPEITKLIEWLDVRSLWKISKGETITLVVRSLWKISKGETITLDMRSSWKISKGETITLDLRSLWKTSKGETITLGARSLGLFQKGRQKRYSTSFSWFQTMSSSRCAPSAHRMINHWPGIIIINSVNIRIGCYQTAESKPDQKCLMNLIQSHHLDGQLESFVPTCEQR